MQNKCALPPEHPTNYLQKMVPFAIKGALAPVFTPINEDFTVNYGEVPAYLEYLVDKRIQGVLVCGTTGEGPSLNVAERKKLAEAWVAAARSRQVQVIVQVGGAPLPDVKELAKHAEEIQADAILTLPELYFKPKDAEQLVVYLEEVSKAAPTRPLLYYHFPMMTTVNVGLKEVFALASARIPNFKGLKGDLDVALLVADHLTQDRRIFIGDHVLATAALLGHTSSIATVTNLFPRLVTNILEAVKMGDITSIRELQERLNKMVADIASEGDWVPAMKAGMELVTGLKVGPPRPPLRPLSEEERENIRENLIKNQIQII